MAPEPKARACVPYPKEIHKPHSKPALMTSQSCRLIQSNGELTSAATPNRQKAPSGPQSELFFVVVAAVAILVQIQIVGLDHLHLSTAPTSDGNSKATAAVTAIRKIGSFLLAFLG